MLTRPSTSLPPSTITKTSSSQRHRAARRRRSRVYIVCVCRYTHREQQRLSVDTDDLSGARLASSRRRDAPTYPNRSEHPAGAATRRHCARNGSCHVDVMQEATRHHQHGSHIAALFRCHERTQRATYVPIQPRALLQTSVASAHDMTCSSGSYIIVHTVSCFGHRREHMMHHQRARFSHRAVDGVACAFAPMASARPRPRTCLLLQILFVRDGLISQRRR